MRKVLIFRMRYFDAKLLPFDVFIPIRYIGKFCVCHISYSLSQINFKHSQMLHFRQALVKGRHPLSTVGGRQQALVLEHFRFLKANKRANNVR